MLENYDFSTEGIEYIYIYSKHFINSVYFITVIPCVSGVFVNQNPLSNVGGRRCWELLAYFVQAGERLQ